MGRAGVWWICGALTLALTSGCTGADSSTRPAGTRSAGPATGPPSSPASGSPTSTAPGDPSTPTSPSATATAVRSVPVDQIPPGHPTRWVPAGVPTTAKYREPGDVVPMFTQAMFKRNQAGALATAAYYFDARDWALATGDPVPFQIICTSTKCAHDAPYIQRRELLHQYAAGGRITARSLATLRSPVDNADLVIQFQVKIAARKILGPAGNLIESSSTLKYVDNVYLKWVDSLWRISQENLAT